MAESETVAVLGAGGTMGFPIARNLSRAGADVRAWNRSRAKAEPLARDGAVVCETAAEAARGAGVVLTMLADADAVLAVMGGAQGALAAAPDDVLWLQMSTIGIAGTERCAALAAARGATFVDAPVLGTRLPAEQGQLIVLASGPADALDALASIFETLGQRTLELGDVGAGTRLKIVVNAWIVAVVEGAAETVALAEGIGVDPADFLAAVAGGSLDMPYLRTKAGAMIDRDFTPAFKLRLAAKDARLALDAARAQGLDLPLVETIAHRLTAGAKTHGNEDMSATFLTSKRGKGGA